VTFLRGPSLDVRYLLEHDWWKDVDIGDDDACWPWLQSTASHGYGQTWDGITVRLAHRVAWTLTHGAIPPDMTIDHVCRNRRCCNPAHLRLLPNVENARLNGNGDKTHCPRGHEYAGANLYVAPRGDRRCRECARTVHRRAA
jgi:hypothetical protein